MQPQPLQKAGTDSVDAWNKNDLKKQLDESFALFVRYMSDEDYWDPFNQDLCEFVQFGGPSSVDGVDLLEPKYKGKFFKNKSVVLPRGGRKTTILTIRYPQWKTLSDLDLRTLIILNTANNASAKLSRIKQEFESEAKIYSMWPEAIPIFGDVTWTNHKLIVNRRMISEDATFDCGGINSAVTSRHCDLVVFDDPTSPEKGKQTAELLLPSLDQIELSIGRFKLTKFLQDNPKKAETLLATTRWADNDIIDWVRNNYSNFAYYEMKIIVDGKPLMQRFPMEVIDQMRIDLGPYFFSCLCMNTPLESSMRAVQEDDILYWQDGDRFGDDPGRMCIFVDPAMGKKKTEGCHTGIIVLEYVDDLLIVRETISEYLDPSQTAKKVVDLVEDWGAKWIGIEDVAMQMALAEPIKRGLHKRHFDGVTVKGIEVKNRSKDERFEGTTSWFRNHQVYIPKDDRFFKTQLLAYPFTKKRDLLDAFALSKKWYNAGAALEKISVGREAAKVSRDHLVNLEREFSREARERMDGMQRMRTTITKPRSAANLRFKKPSPYAGAAF